MLIIYFMLFGDAATIICTTYVTEQEVSKFVGERKFNHPINLSLYSRAYVWRDTLAWINIKIICL